MRLSRGMNAPDPIKSLASPVDMVDICLLRGGIYKVSVNDDLQGVCVCVCVRESNQVFGWSRSPGVPPRPICLGRLANAPNQEDCQAWVQLDTCMGKKNERKERETERNLFVSFRFG
jgi:hypothetical protein